MRQVAIAAAATLLAAPAYAQNAQLTEDQVRSFIEQASREAQELVQAGDWSGIQSWHQRHLADDARFAAKGTLLTKAGPTISFAATMDRKSLSRFAHMMMLSPQQVGPKSIEDFTLQAQVQNVMELPGGEASATVVFHEAGTIAVPAPAQPGEGQATQGAQSQGGAQGQQGPAIPTERVVFQTTSTCDLRLSTTGGEAVKIAMAACEAITTIG